VVLRFTLVHRPCSPHDRDDEDHDKAANREKSQGVSPVSALMGDAISIPQFGAAWLSCGFRGFGVAE
jgi:hypothetical protein